MGVNPAKKMANFYFTAIKKVDNQFLECSDVKFIVLNFTGEEKISEPYVFEINLGSDINYMNMLVQENAILYGCLTIELVQVQETSRYYGYVSHYNVYKSHGGDTQFITNVKFSPQLNLLKSSKGSNLHVNSSVHDVIKRMQMKGGLSANYFKDMVSGKKIKFYSYDPVNINKYNLLCQFDEGNLNFFSRILEDAGLSYYFEQPEDEQPEENKKNNKNKKNKKLIKSLTESVKIVIDDFPIRKGKITYEAEALRVGFPCGNMLISNIICESVSTPRSLEIQNFVYEKAHLGKNGVIRCSVDIYKKYKKIFNSRNKSGHDFYTEMPFEGVPTFNGQEVIYGERFIDSENQGDGNFWARIRAEEILCRSLQFKVQSTAVPIYAGQKVVIAHNSHSMERQFLVVSVKHHANPELVGQNVNYFNELTLIPADIPFRPQRKTPKPKIYGIMNGFIDSNRNDDLPDLDNVGRYLVRLPFIDYPEEKNHPKKNELKIEEQIENNNVQDSKNSIRVRLMTPFAGNQYGIHFPLHKGTEVILSFIDGDPDLPVIIGAVFNSEHKNPVTNKNANMGGIIKTKANNVISLDDTKDTATAAIKGGSGSFEVFG